MRKINTTTALNSENFYSTIQVFIINEDGTKERLVNDVDLKYTPEQVVLIGQVNNTLLKNGKELLSEDEITYLILEPDVEEPTEQDLQKLAGFTVEKKIIYIQSK
jgi:hypothetical protein